jgi:pyruvate/2-oxoglutarate dehydrogenase complex dihydrolipoamide dehydrogenase (E3) component
LGVLDRLYLAIIGAGSAGFSAAVTAAGQGARVALGGGTIGGTCVNVGCVPSKTLIRAAETLHQARATDARTGKNVLVFVRSGDGSRDVAAADQKSMAFWRRFDAARWRSTTARSRVGARSHKVTVVKECAIVLTHVPASEIKPRSLRRASLVFGVERFNYAPRGTY